MSKNYTIYLPSFKEATVKKALSRSPDTPISEVARVCGVALSSLQRWITASGLRPSPVSKVSPPVSQEISGDAGGNHGEEASTTLKREKRPQDWTLEERLQAIIDTACLSTEAMGAYCRREGLYPHHIKQWRASMTHQGSGKATSESKELKRIKAQNKQLQRELARKEQALAETAALLVLKKKAQTWWEGIEAS